jgi:hypothetical protein
VQLLVQDVDTASNGTGRVPVSGATLIARPLKAVHALASDVVPVSAAVAGPVRDGAADSPSVQDQPSLGVEVENGGY